MEIDLRAFRYAVEKIDDGFVFEAFGLNFLSARLGYSFNSVGGIKDKGIDGLEHSSFRTNFETNIYQLSIDRSPESKIKNTLEKLIENRINFSTLTYVTNQKVKDIEILSDEFLTITNKIVRIFDLEWLTNNANYCPGTIYAYNTFVTSYFHQFNQPGKISLVSDLDSDPRLFVFLRQQLDTSDKNVKLDELLADTLILYGLEGTDPDKNIFKTKEEIKSAIKQYIKFDPKVLNEIIDKRLISLSSKPRKIQYHTKANGFCLPYETRFQIQERNIRDAALEETFLKQTEEIIKRNLRDEKVSIRYLATMIKNTIHKIYHQQGLEFSNFILQGKSAEVIEKDLPGIISQVVSESTVIEKNKSAVKTALLMSIRELVYHGTNEQKEFLRCLSNTCLMMFMLQWDPKIATYFETMASKLNVFVCTSIIIPALSEYYLPPENRRHWQLLKGAKEGGVSLIVNDEILGELISHFQMIKNKYFENFKGYEEIYINSEDDIISLYVDEILLRAYFYARKRNEVEAFDKFIDTFVDPSLKTVRADLIEFLKEEFGIIYMAKERIGVEIDKKELNLLYERLKGIKSHDVKAKTDSQIILMIFKIREKDNEEGTSGIFGYRTWWLSKDTTTYRIVNQIFAGRYPVSCYMRPDFLYNYIVLCPKRSEVDEAYKHLFPSLIGVNLSFHLPKEIVESVQKGIAEHSQKTPARIKAILRNLTEKIKSDPSIVTRAFVGDLLREKAEDLLKK